MGKPNQKKHLSALSIVLIYALFSAIWILVSDKLLAFLISDRELMTLLSIGKGFLFIVITSLLLYLLLNVFRKNDAEVVQTLASDKKSSRRLAYLFISQIILMPLIPLVLYEIQGEQIKESAKNNLMAFSKVKKERIENWLTERYSDAIMLQHNEQFVQAISLINLGGSIHTGAIDLPIAQLLNNKRYQAVRILGTTNQILAVFGHLPVHRFVMPLIAVDVPEPENMLANSSITTQWYWDENEQLFLDIQVALFDPRTHDFIGTLVLTQNLLTQLLPHVQSWPNDTQTGTIYLVQQNDDRVSFIKIPANDVIHSTSIERMMNPTMASLMDKIMNDQSGFYAGLDLDNQNVFASFKPIQYSGWYLVVQQDQDEIFTPLYNLIKWTVLFVFFGGLMMLFFIRLLWRQQQYSHQLELRQQTDEKDRLLRHFFDLPLFGMAITHSDNGRWIRFNEHLSNMLGYSYDELMQLDLQSLTPEQYQSVDQDAMQAIEQGLSDGFGYEKQLRHKDGHLIDVNIETRCVRSADKKVAFIISVIEDITQRKTNELLLERQRNLYDMLSLTNQAIVRFKDKDTLFTKICEIAVEHGKFLFAWFGAFDDVNEHISITHTFGDDRGFTDWIVRVNEEHPDLIRQTAAMRALKSGENLIMNNYQLQATTNPFHQKARESGIASSAYFIIREQGKVIGSLNLYATSADYFNDEITNTLAEMAVDVSFALDNLRRDKKLLQSEERFRNAILNSPAPTVIYEAKGKGLTMNRRWTELTGYTLEDIPSRSVWMNIATPLEPDNPWLIQDNGPEIVQPVYAGEYQILCKDGSIRYWDMLTSPLSTDDSGERLLVTMANDVTERRFAEEALRHSEQLFHTLATFVPVGIFRLDLKANPVYINEAGSELLHWKMNDASSWLHTIHPEDKARIQQDWLPQLLQGISTDIHCRLQYETEAELTTRWIVMNARPEFNEENDISGYIGSITDISSQKENELVLKQSATVFDNTQEGILITDPAANIIRANQAITTLFGYSQEELIGQSARILESANIDADERETISKTLDQDGFWRGEIICQTKDGRQIPLLVSVNIVRDDEQLKSNYVIVFSDISKLKETEQQLSYLAHHDSLTQLPNRAYLAVKLANAIAHAKIQKQKIALLMLDLDRFKDVNDSFGHPIGDALLEEVANRFRQIQRENDSIFRLGGDEFTILMENTSNLDTINQYADDIIQLLKTPFRLPNGKDVVIGTSIGISLFPDHGKTPEDLLQQADAAMYRAKASGRSCYKYYSQEFTDAAAQRVDIEIRLRRAIENNEFIIYLQPQYDIASNLMIGAEALIRWQDPEKGMIPPNLFIPAAEETGLIKQIGEWVLRETCQLGAKWLADGLPPLSLAVNISSVQFHYSDLLHSVEAVLDETKFPPSSLELEITESALMSHENEAAEILNELRRFGVSIAMDDFGTGYSSLAYLKRFPLDILKIDKSFVDDIPESKDDMEIAATIVAMAKTLRLRVLAEGVETEEQLAFLKYHGCDYFQGYLMNPPLPVEKFEALLRQQATTLPKFLTHEHYESP